MNILLVYRNHPDLDLEYHARLMPVGLPLMAAVLRRDGHDARLANFSGLGNRRMAEILKGFRPALVGISQLTHNRHEAIRVAELVKKVLPDALTVLGGPHATFCHEDILLRHPAVDMVVLGEGEEALLDIVRNHGSGQPGSIPLPGVAVRCGQRVVRGDPRRPLSQLDDLPLALDGLTDAYHVDPRRQGEFVISSRGCPGRCTFCSSPSFWPGGLRFRSAASLLAEVEALRDRYGLLYLSIRDDTFTSDRQRVLEFCHGLEERRLRILWNCQSRVGAVDRELVVSMRRAGCECIQFGIESGSPAVLASLGKGNRIEQAVTACRQVRETGMSLALYLISRVPGETDADRDATIGLIRQLRPHDVQVAPLAYYPGTRLFAEAVKRGAVPADLFDATGPGLYVCSDGPSARRHDALATACNRIAQESAYTWTDLDAQRQLVGYTHAGSLLAGEYWEGRGDWRRAEDTYREICQCQPDNPWGWLALGELLGGRGQGAKAEEALCRVTDLVPNHAPAHTLRGEAALLRGAPQEAERHFTRALALDPHDKVAAAALRGAVGSRGAGRKRAKP